MLTCKDVTPACWTNISLGIRIGHLSLEVGTLTWYWVYSNYSIGGTTSRWLILVTCLSFLEMNRSCPLILKQYIGYILGFMGTKDGTMLYDIGYGG
jgi:hypothetical protein